MGHPEWTWGSPAEVLSQRLAGSDSGRVRATAVAVRVGRGRRGRRGGWKDLNRLLTEITQIVSTAGWLQHDRDPLDRIANASAACNDTDPTFKRVSDQVFNLESFHAFPHHPALCQTMELHVGPHLLVRPKPIPRLVFPNAEHFSPITHQDHHAIAGDIQTFTAWMPLHDCTTKLGPLQILAGSHRYGLQKTPPGTGVIPRKTARGDAWVGGRINAGAILIFRSLTVHAASPHN